MSIDLLKKTKKSGTVASFTSRTELQESAQLQQQVNDVVGIMQQNIDSVRDRGENLDALQHKTSDLEQGAVQFRKGASGVRRQMYWKNMKMRFLIGLGVVILLIIIIVPIVKAK
ncbi:hypothetical protein BGX28_003664 [Mortierella sp. GBA30]|nr:hypothetical protein BGX28_003664 [Mortierella sp. GBA30]